MKDIVETYLESLPFVQWDRFTYSDGGKSGLEKYSVYGWIYRQKDSYKDFVVLNVQENRGNMHTVSFITSSAQYTHEIGRILGCEANHEDCRRVEEYFPIQNAIHL